MAAPVTSDIVVDKAKSHIKWANSNIALHSHHYHFQLQYTLGLTDFVDGAKLTREIAQWAIHALLRNKFGEKPQDSKEVLRFASELFQAMGFGRLQLAGATEASAPNNMYADGWTPQWGYSKGRLGQCDFPAGFIAGALQVAYGRPYEVRETACKSKGAASCGFEIKEAKDAPKDVKYDTSSVGGPAVDDAPAAGAKVQSNVNEAGIMDAVLSLPLTGDGTSGLANKFGVLVNWTPQQFYSGLEFNFINRLAEYDLGLERSAEELLFFDGEACALNTFHGITRSAEWNGLIKPMLSKQGDAVVALAAVANCLGWGKYQITDLVAAEGVKVKLFGGQEGLGYRTLFGVSKKPRCYAASGAVRALMEVFLPGEVVESKFGRFKVEEKQCVAMGHPHCEFVATRAA